MSYKTPTRGNMLQLWDQLSPDQGYSREEIEKIAKENSIGDYTVGNLLNTRRKYLILKKDTQLYYRNDSELAAQIATTPKSDAPKSAAPKSAAPKSGRGKKPKPAIAKSPGTKSPRANAKTAQPKSKAESNPVDELKKAEISVESIAKKIHESTDRLKEAKLRKEKVTVERQRLEGEENSLTAEITELESSLQSIQLFL
jgi:hypothetical protein